MPNRPAAACATPGCVGREPCPLHPRLHWQDRTTWRPNPERPKTAQRGYAAAHRRWRAQVLAAHPFCTGDPPRAGCPLRAKATVADHLVPLVDGGTWSVTNGQGLCAHCHGRKSLRQRRR